MEKGAESRPDFMADISGFATKLVEEVRGMEGERLAAPSRSHETLGACPKCGAPVIETKKATVARRGGRPGATSRSGNESPAKVSA